MITRLDRAVASIIHERPVRMQGTAIKYWFFGPYTDNPNLVCWMWLHQKRRKMAYRWELEYINGKDPMCTVKAKTLRELKRKYIVWRLTGKDDQNG
jgi:hypothetical protein